VAEHNVASIRVLEKCGFRLEREESVEVAAEGEEVAELLLVLR
jgi:RimJ/RimL family protein N-acetyltransferase